MTAEEVGTVLALLAFIGAMGRWLIHAWRRAVMENPSRDTAVLHNMNGIVTALNMEIDRIQSELDRLRSMVAALESDRDTWKNRALALGWKAPGAPRDV